MSRLCDYVLSADERVRFAMHIDHLGNIKCIKSVGLYRLPPEVAEKLADTLAVLTTGILKTLSLHHGSFHHIIIKHENYTTIGQPFRNGYFIYTTTEPVEHEVIKNVNDTVQIYEKEGV